VLWATIIQAWLIPYSRGVMYALVRELRCKASRSELQWHELEAACCGCEPYG